MIMLRKPDRFFAPAWIGLTALAIPLALLLAFTVMRVMTMVIGDFIYVQGVRHITEDYVFGYIFFPLLSLVTGVMQYGLLRRYLPRMGWWVLVTGAGWLLGFLIMRLGGSRAAGVWLAKMINQPWAIDPAAVVLGLSIGVAQWLLLRRHLPRAGWWIAANVVGWGLLLPLTGDSLDQFDLFLLGLLPACVTAAVLALLMHQAPPDASAVVSR